MWYFEVVLPPVRQDGKVFWDEMAVPGRMGSRELSVLDLRIGHLQMQCSVLNTRLISMKSERTYNVPMLQSNPGFFVSGKSHY